MISETKLDDIFPQGQFLIEGIHSPFRFDRNKTGGGILLYVRKTFQLKFTKRSGLLIVYIIRIRTISKIISRTLDTCTTKYKNILLLGDSNACADDETMKNVCSSYGLHSFIKHSTCYKSPKNPSCTDLILTNTAKSFQSTFVIEIGLSDFHRMTISVFKMNFCKLPPKFISYRGFKQSENDRFINSL